MKIEDDLHDLFVRKARSVSSSGAEWERVSQRVRRTVRMRRVAAVTVALSVSSATIAGLLWATVSRDLSDTDPATPTEGHVEASVIATIPIAEDAQGLDVFGDTVWVGVPTPNCTGELAIVDAVSKSVRARSELDFTPQAIVAADNAVWVSGYRCGQSSSTGDGAATFDAVVARVDPSSGYAEAVTPLPGNEVSGIVENEGIWVGVSGDAPGNGHVVRIDSRDLSVTFDIPVSDIGQLVASGESVWVESANERSSGVMRIDVTTGGAELLPIGAIPAFTVADGIIWTSGPLSVDADAVSAVQFDAADGQPVGEPYSLPNSPFLPFGSDAGGVWFVGQREGSAGVARLDKKDGVVETFVAVTDHAALEAIYESSASEIWVLDQPRGVLTAISIRDAG